MLSTPGGIAIVREYEAVVESIGQHATLCPQSGNREQTGSACPSDSLLPVWLRLLKGPQPPNTVLPAGTSVQIHEPLGGHFTFKSQNLVGNPIMILGVSPC